MTLGHLVTINEQQYDVVAASDWFVLDRAGIIVTAPFVANDVSFDIGFEEDAAFILVGKLECSASQRKIRRQPVNRHAAQIPAARKLYTARNPLATECRRFINGLPIEIEKQEQLM